MVCDDSKQLSTLPEANQAARLTVMTPHPDLMRRHLEKWRKELIGLSRKNRVLYFKHLKSGSLEFEQDALTVLNGLNSRRGWSFYLPPDPEPTGSDDDAIPPILPRPPRKHELVIASHQKKTSKQTISSLKTLSSKSRAGFLDAGLWVLYLGLGMLRWRDGSDEVMSPLYLLPVDLKLKGEPDQWRMERSEEGEPALNPSLAVKFEQERGISLPSLDELEDNDYQEVLESVRRAVRSTGSRIEETAVLSTFTFQKEVIYRDLRDNEATVANHPMVRLLANGPNSDEHASLSFESEPDNGLDEKHPPEDLACVLDADVTQRQCIIAARQGHSFVMDGPPGTGKSQTIANVIAQLIRDGKTVLFVSEKAAALDVVFSRLAAAKLDRFVLDLHSHKATRKAVALELGKALEETPQAKSSFSPADRSQIIKERQKLTDYAIAVNEVRQPAQRSLHDVIGEISELIGSGDYPAISLSDFDAVNLDIEALDRISDLSTRLGRAWAPVERGDEFLWRNLVAGYQAPNSHETDCLQRIDQLRSTLLSLESVSAAIHEKLSIAGKSTPAMAEWLQKLLKLVEKRPPVVSAWLISLELESDTAKVRQLALAANELAEVEAQLASEITAWRQIDPAAAEKLEKSFESLINSNPRIDINQENTARDIAELKHALDEAGEHIKQAQQLSELLATAFSAGQIEKIPLAAIDRLVELGRFATSDCPPEQGWFNEAGLQAASEALETLSEIVPRYISSRDKITRDFKPDVLELDLALLKERRDERARIIGKLGRSYRADKATMAAVTISGKATGQTMMRLEELLAWQKMHRELKKAESVHAAALGIYYPDCDHADFERAESAINIAARATETAVQWSEAGGSVISAQCLASVIGRGAAIAGVVDTAEHAATHLEALRHGTLASQAGPSMLALQLKPFSHVSSWCSDASSACSALINVLSAIDEMSGSNFTIEQARELLETRSEQSRQAAQVKHQAHCTRHLIGEMSEEPDSNALNNACEWVAAIRSHLDGEIELPTAELILTSDLRESDIAMPSESVKAAMDCLLKVFEEGAHRNDLTHKLQHSYSSAHDLLNALEYSVTDISIWSDYVEITDALKSDGLAQAVKECMRHSLPEADVAPTLKLAVLRRRADQIMDGDKRLKPYKSTSRDEIRKTFQVLDQKLVRNAAADVINACASRWPRSTAGGAGIIRKNALFKKRHMPVRRLFSQAGDSVQRIKPCFMMSPLSVSQFLPSDFAFDAVIFDEASQVREADAIGCIYRGHQLIVTGDDKQLPPTSFFDRLADTDEDELNDDMDADLGFESVLDRCKAQGFTPLPLRWHYRSQHEDLITYSNYQFYDGKLHTFPGAADDTPDLGVELFIVNSIYRRGATRDNLEEASEVVNRVLYHQRHHPQATIGVVALSTAQQQAVETAIEQRSSDEPELRKLLDTDDRLSGFFVKNLESVQGDERDIVILTIGYGPDEHGKLTMNFGPINRVGGERRLNVAITRARRRVEIVTSISSSNIRVPSGEAGGLAHLRGYLDFAERGRNALAINLQGSLGDSESPFEEEVLRVVRSLGLEAVPQVGVAGYRIDIGIRHPDKPGQYLLGVECDGAFYHSSKVARDRDRLRQEILESLGWTIHRVWSTAWFTDRKREIRALQIAVNNARKGSSGRTESTPVSGPKVRIAPTDWDAKPKWAHEYIEPTVRSPLRNADFCDQRSREFIIKQIREIVDKHSPVHIDIVLRVVRDAWGLGRAGSRIQEAFNKALSLAIKEEDIEKRGDWLHNPYTKTRVRVPALSGAPQRPVDKVPPDEIELAILNLLKDAGPSPRSSLQEAWARLYSWNRVGPEIKKAFDHAVCELIKAGKVTDEEEQLSAMLT